jgi:hypothetical protein
LDEVGELAGFLAEDGADAGVDGVGGDDVDDLDGVVDSEPMRWQRSSACSDSTSDQGRCRNTTVPRR